MGFSLRQLRYFVTISELGQVSRAAEQLHVTQSAVTVAIRDLEKELRFALFNREPHGMELTDDGRQFLVHAHAIEVAVANARNMPRAREIAEDITLAATSTLVGYFLPEHIHRLRGLHPGLNIHLVEMTRPDIEKGLLAGTIKIALLNTLKVNSRRIQTLRITESARRLWVCSGHPLTARPQVHLRDIEKEPLMLLSADEAAETALQYWGSYGLSPNVKLRSSSIEAIRSMVANGLGVAIASDMQFRPWSLEGKRVETALLVEKIPPLEVGLAWKAGSVLPPSAQLIADYFRQRFLAPSHRHKAR